MVSFLMMLQPYCTVYIQDQVGYGEEPCSSPACFIRFSALTRIYLMIVACQGLDNETSA